MWGFESSLSVCLVWLAWFIRTGCCSCIGLDTSQQWMWSGQGLKHPTGLVRQMLQSTFLWAITRIKKLPETGHGGANARSRNVTSPSFAGQLMLSATAANPAAAAAASSSTTKKEREKTPQYVPAVNLPYMLHRIARGIFQFAPINACAPKPDRSPTRLSLGWTRLTGHGGPPLPRITVHVPTLPMHA